MAEFRVAPAARAALDQASLRWPRRSKLSDGLTGDVAHRSRRSFHNPSNGDGVWRDDGTVLAFDLTYDPANGCDAHRLVRAAVARGDQRIAEAISQGLIWTRVRRSEGWRRYDGSNPHNQHAHVSIAWAHRNDTSPWWTVPQAEQEDEVTADDIKQIAAAVRAEVQKDIITVLRATDQPSIKSLDLRLQAIEKALGSGQ